MRDYVAMQGRPESKRLGRGKLRFTTCCQILIPVLILYNLGATHQKALRLASYTPLVNDMPIKTGPDSTVQQKMTVVLTTYKDSLRNPCVIGQWLPLDDIVREIIVVWDYPVSQYLELVSAAVANYSIPVRLITDHKKASLNNRYTIYEEIHTDAVFAIDDDIRIRHGGVRGAFEEWKRHPDLMINFSRQDVGFDGKQYFYKKHWMSNWNQSSTLGLTLAGGTVVHKRYYELYSKEYEAMSFVDKVHNGEDILMNWVIAKDLRRRNISSGVAVYMYPFFPSFPPMPNIDNHTYEASGISSRPGHFEKRDDCIRKFVEIFGFAITQSNKWSVGWLPFCTLDMVGCKFPFRDEPRLNARTCKYLQRSGNDIYE